MAASTADRPFPVVLVCPSCGAPLTADAACGCAAATRLEIWNGIPRLLFGQRYRGECSSEKMAELLRRMDEVPWRRALADVVPDEPLRAHLTGNVGPDFVHGMPWDEIETVLDVGAGMGFMTAPLAERAKTVVALEAAPERALFQRKRAAQDGFSNWRPVIAGGASFPFAPGTFDLVTLSGVFESVGLWGEGDPEMLQRLFLDEVLRVLKPGGYLYAGVETRFALRAFRGARDRSGLPFTGLMPRRLADWYCRRRADPFDGSERRADGYRTYTYTPDQYRAMFAEAGFGRVDVFGVRDGYNRQKAVYPMNDAPVRRFTRELADPPASRQGRLLRWFSNAGPWSRTLEDEVVVFAKKSAAAGRLVWTGLPHDGPVAQFSSGDKVFVLCFDGEPACVYKGPKTAEAGALLAREFEFLQAASRRGGPASESWPMRWPKPLGVQPISGRAFYQYEFARGSLLSGELLPVSFDHDRFGRLFARLVDGYVELCGKMTAASGVPDGKAWNGLLDRLAAVPVGDAACARKIQAACARLRGRNWPTRTTHGDLSLSNAMLLPDGGMILLDWENASAEGLVAIDLTRLLNDALNEARLLPPDSRRAVAETARKTVRGALSRLGVEPGDDEDVEALFVADQFRMWLSRDPNAVGAPWARNLIREFLEREFAPAVSSAPRTRGSGG